MIIVLLANKVNSFNHTKCVSLSNEEFNLLLLIYILFNTVKNFTTIHLLSNKIDVSEVLILVLTFLRKYVFQIKQAS